MDPHVNVEQGGPVSESQKSDEGASYLRRIREQASGSLPSSPAPSVPTPAAVSASPSGTERRRSPRFRCSGSAEFRVAGSDVRMWGTLADVSLHGCYVEMNNTFPVDTRVSLVLEAMGIRAHMQAAVRVSYPFLGMGMSFTEVELGQQAQLEKLLAAVASHNAAPDPGPAQESPSSPSLDSVDPRILLRDIVQFFSKNSLLSRAEFYELARHSRRTGD